MRESEEGGMEGGEVKTDFPVNVFGCVSPTTLCVSVYSYSCFDSLSA